MSVFWGQYFLAVSHIVKIPSASFPSQVCGIPLPLQFCLGGSWLSFGVMMVALFSDKVCTLAPMACSCFDGKSSAPGLLLAEWSACNVTPAAGLMGLSGRTSWRSSGAESCEDLGCKFVIHPGHSGQQSMDLDKRRLPWYI